MGSSRSAGCCRLPRRHTAPMPRARRTPTGRRPGSSVMPLCGPRSRASGKGNFKVYGVRKVWRQELREGIYVARCTVARLMGQMGLHGAVRGKSVKTTISNSATPCPADHVNRQFQAPRPNALWVSDFTYGAPRPRLGWGAYVRNARRKEERRNAIAFAAEAMSPSGGDLLSTGRVT